MYWALWRGVSKPEAIMIWKILLPEKLGAAQKMKSPRIRRRIRIRIRRRRRELILEYV